jgi:hypothetical protein
MKTTTAPSALLSPDEMSRIEEEGMGFGLALDLVQEGFDGKLVFSVKGIAAYQHAIEHHRCPAKLSGIRTLADLHKLQLGLQRLVLETLKRELQEMHRKNPGLNKYRALTDAVVGRTSVQARDALRTSLMLRQAGDNVIGFPGLRTKGA